ncbi:MAG: hypothetical protein AB7G80_05115 [Dongiaceae bacterium]
MNERPVAPTKSESKKLPPRRLGKVLLRNKKLAADILVEADPKGRTVVHAKMRDTSLLTRLYRSRRISGQELAAGQAYSRDLQIAGLTGRYARSSWQPLSSAQTGPDTSINIQLSDGRIAAQERLKRRDALLGPLAASCLFHILGHGLSAKDWAHRIRSTPVAGISRDFNQHQAVGFFIAALGLLATHAKALNRSAKKPNLDREEGIS